MDLDQALSLINTIRFADIIASHKNTPHAIKMTTCVKSSDHIIEFHIPKRCTEIITAIESKQKILIKYSTEYAEISSEWCENAPKDKRISSIIGFEAHIHTTPEELTLQELEAHLYDTARQNHERIGDTFSPDQLNRDYFAGNIALLKGYRVHVSADNLNTTENFLQYRDEVDKQATLQHLENLAQKHPENKFSIAAHLLQKTLKMNET